MARVRFSTLLELYRDKRDRRMADWFGPGEMRFFNTILPEYGHRGPGGMFFVTSESPHGRGDRGCPGGEPDRKWSVREIVFDDDGFASVETVGEFHSYEDSESAEAEAKRLADGGVR